MRAYSEVSSLLRRFPVAMIRHIKELQRVREECVASLPKATQKLPFR